MSHRTALVTGASRGIGEAFARLLAAEGWSLLLTARGEADLERVRADLRSAYPGVEVRIFSADLGRAEQIEALLGFVTAEGLEIELLINNAGFTDYGRFAEADLDRLRQMIAVNVMAVVALTHGLLPAMLDRHRGGVLNVASTAAFQGLPGMSVYAGTKAFVLTFSEGLAEELDGTGVDVSCLCPGPTQTEFMNAANMEATASDSLFEDPIDVARRGLEALRARDVVRVSGIINSLGVFGTRLLPRKAIVKIANNIFKKSTRKSEPPQSSPASSNEER